LAAPLRHGAVIKHAAFSRDSNGRFVVTAGTDRAARVWDSATGSPITPPLVHGDDVNCAEFAPVGNRLVTASDDNLVRFFDIAPALSDLPVEDLVALAKVVSARLVDRSGGLSAIDPLERRRLWARLRTKYPHAFGASTADIVAWYRREAAACEAAHDYSGQLWHLDRLVESGGATWATLMNRASVNAKLAGPFQATNKRPAFQRHWASALADYDRAEKLGATTWWLYSERAIARRMLNDHARAKADFDKAASSASNVWWFWWMQGESFSKVGDSDGAALAFSRVAELEPKVRQPGLHGGMTR
jgi:hypothetical protein